MQEYTPDDIVAGVLAYMTESKFIGDQAKIHTCFARLRKDKPILREFPFSDSSIFPFSPLLERVIGRLQLARIIGMQNPDFERFIIRDGAKEYIRREVLNYFNPGEKRQLMDIAETFERECGC